MQDVTVILPTYNRMNKIGTAIESVRNQTYTNWKMIIVDDASTDGTEELVRKIGDKRIEYVRNRKNEGPAYSRNVGVRLTETEYIAFQDSDTIWHSKKLELQLKRMEEESVAMVYHPYQLNGELFPSEEIPLEEKQGDIYRRLLYCPMIGTPCMLMRKDIFDQVGGFAEELKCLEDYELSLRIAKAGRIGFVQDVLVKAEDTEHSVGKNSRNEMDALFFIMLCYYEDLEGNPFAKKLLFNRISKIAVENSLMERFYGKMEEYLSDTGQELENMMKLYES